MESGELDQSEAPPFWRFKYPRHGISVCSTTGRNEYDCLQKQSKAVEAANNQYNNAHQKASSCVPVWPRWVMVFRSHWWLNVVGVIELCTMDRVRWWGHFLSSPQARALVKLGMSRTAAAATATSITRFQSPSLSWGQWEEKNDIRG